MSTSDTHNGPKWMDIGEDVTNKPGQNTSLLQKSEEDEASVK